MDRPETVEQSQNAIYLEWLSNPFSRALLDVIREAVLIVDCELRVIFANRVARDLFTFPAQESPRLIDITRNKDIYNGFTQALREKRLYERHITLMSSNGERIIDLRVESIMASQLSNEEKIIGAVATLFDNTRLEVLEKVRREFFANLSHELRTPLTSIQTYVETLLSGALYDKQNNVKFLKVIAKHAARMQNLAQDISDLASIEAGKININPRPIRLAHMAREIFELLKDSINTRQIRFDIQIDESHSVVSDAKALEQIIFNLVQNAVNFNRPNGSIIVKARLTDNQHIITVQDTGIGIEGKHITRIFERLYRVDESRSRKEGGTGLGLAIVKHFAQALGGSISAESTPNQGSTFILTIPRSAIDHQDKKD
jgi:two-component system, OmpR family, phosphate regulon sensor histidine kinase PhoR